MAPANGGGSAAQHSGSMYSMLAHVPGVKCVVPSDAYTAKVNGMSVAEQVEDGWLKETFIPTVAKRGAAIIDARGASSAASAANAAIDHVFDWVNGTSWTSCSLPSDGSYGVPEGLISSFPCRSANGQWEIIQGVDINAFSRERIDASVAELAEEREAVKALGLI